MNIFRKISLHDTVFPKGGRIVSLVPSQTELLFDLGLADSVVGVTKFCIHPAAARERAIIGGTKQVDFDKIAGLKPDLIIGNKEENAQGFMEQLALKYPVYMSDIYTLDDAYAMISAIGDLTYTAEIAANIRAEIVRNFALFTKNRGFSATNTLPKTCGSGEQYVYR
jgi:ABC-type Fe3+-hydroxamate transport system substrate-binding protein